MRRVGVVTSSRADYGILRPVLRALQDDPRIGLDLYVTGTHLLPAFGTTVTEIEADGFEIGERVEMLAASDSAEGIASSMALGTLAFGGLLSRRSPDLLLVLGDRFEIHAAAVAALPHGIPLAHIHGGESSEGAIDERIRHSITKLAHLHFPSTEHYGRRIVQMGEEPWRVTVSGAPSIDNLGVIEVPDRATLAHRLAFDPDRPFLLVTYHPVTLDPERESDRLDALLAAIGAREEQILITHPNADAQRHAVLGRIEAFASERSDAQLLVNAGTEAYFGLMTEAEAMVGNSSSGIIEAASFELPVVNVGIRQQGRLRPPNVIDAPDDPAAIGAAIDRATSTEFRAGLRGLANPYGDGGAAARIVERLATVPLGEELLIKRFHETDPLAAEPEGGRA